LAAQACDVPWASSKDRQRVLESLSRTASGSARANLQVYEGIVRFLPDRVWGALLSTSADIISKTGTLIDYSVSLGLRNPSEHTFATLTALLLLCDSGAEVARTLPASQVRDLFSHTKAQFRKRAQKATIIERIPCLPKTTEEFAQLYPATLEHALGVGGCFASPKVSSLDVLTLRNAISLRQRGPPSLGEQVAPRPDASNPMMLFSAMLAAAMAQFGGRSAPAAAAEPTLRFLGPETSPRPCLARTAASSSSLGSFSPNLPSLALPPVEAAPAKWGGSAGACAADEEENEDDESVREPAMKALALRGSVPTAVGRRLSVDEAAETMRAAMSVRDARKKPAASVATAKTATKAEPAVKAGGAKADSKASGAKNVPEGSAEMPKGKKTPRNHRLSATKSPARKTLFRTGRAGPRKTKAIKYKDEKGLKAAIREAEAFVKAELARRDG